MAEEQHPMQQYINSLLDKRGYADSSPEVREQLFNDLASRINEYILAKVIATLSEEDLTAFEKLLDEKKSVVEYQKFAEEHIPNYQTFLTAALLEFQDIYLGA